MPITFAFNYGIITTLIIIEMVMKYLMYGSLLVSLFLCSACGQKGPLIKPDSQEHYKKLNF